MGYPLKIFIDKKVNEDFVCSICEDVLKNPVCLAKCEHIFCKECISKWLQTDKSCPIDRDQISVDDFVRVQKPFLNLLNKLEIKCSFADKGCTDVVNIGNWDQHTAICVFSPDYKTICELGCGAQLTSTEKSSHNCMKYLLEVIKSKDERIVSLVDELGSERRREIIESARGEVSRLLLDNGSLVVNSNTARAAKGVRKSVLAIICKCIQEEHEWNRIKNSILQGMEELPVGPWGCCLETRETIKLKVSSDIYFDVFMADLRIIIWKK